MDPELLKILRCPQSRQSLAKADADVLKKINLQIEKGDCRNQAGLKVTELLEDALIREDARVIYPVRAGIPVLLPDEGIPCS